MSSRPSATKPKLATGFCNARDFHLGVAIDDILSLVALILASAYSYFKFCNSIFKIHFERNDGAALLFLCLAHFLYFVDVREQFAAAGGEMVEPVRE